MNLVPFLRSRRTFPICTKSQVKYTIGKFSIHILADVYRTEPFNAFKDLTKAGTGFVVTVSFEKSSMRYALSVHIIKVTDKQVIGLGIVKYRELANTMPGIMHISGATSKKELITLLESTIADQKKSFPLSIRKVFIDITKSLDENCLPVIKGHSFVDWYLV
jgi:hypothetical protein